MAGFFIENFGCRAARADGEAVSAGLRSAGLNEQTVHEAAFVVVNTCSVTAEADRAARAFIRRAHRKNPAARIVVTGCYAQRAPEELANMRGVSAVIGNSHKALAPEIILNLANARHDSQPLRTAFLPVDSLLAGASNSAPVWADDRFAHSLLQETPIGFGAQTRPNLKIQEGCSSRCTFCVIPLTRGPSRSLPRAAVLERVREFVEAGGNELVLSGINLGRWGRDFSSGLGREPFAGLVRSILEETDLARLRLSSVEPMDWDGELIALMGQHGGLRLARHAHLPLQSGSDAVLRRMHRRYRPWHYADKVSALLRAAGPDLTLGADVMAGFPGETDREFEETLSFIHALPFGYLHLFPFSPRPGTPGWALHGVSPVPREVVDERMSALRSLATEKVQAHRAQLIGRTLPAITLQTPPSLTSQGRTAALTDNFLPAVLEGRIAANQLIRIGVKALAPDATLEGVVNR